MYGLPRPSQGDSGVGPVTIGSFVVYEGSLTQSWGRYRVAAIAERPIGIRYNLSSYSDNTVLLRGVRRESIAPVPSGPSHVVHNPLGRADAILRRFTAVNSDNTRSEDSACTVYTDLSSLVMSLISRNRFVEAETHLLRAELAAELVTPQDFRRGIEQLRIRGDDESYLTQGRPPSEGASASADDEERETTTPLADKAVRP